MRHPSYGLLRSEIASEILSILRSYFADRRGKSSEVEWSILKYVTETETQTGAEVFGENEEPDPMETLPILISAPTKESSDPADLLRALGLYRKLGAAHFKYFEDDFHETKTRSEKLLWETLPLCAEGKEKGEETHV